MSYPPDYHTHTLFSCDSKTPMAAACQAALALGLSELGFSEHYDPIPLDTCHGFFQVAAWGAALADCRRQFSGTLTLRAGLEIGEPHRYAAAAQALLAQYPFDYVIGSLHWVGDAFALAPAFFARPAAEAYRLYFEELERMTRAGNFDILGHFDVVTRAGDAAGAAYAPADYADLIRGALKNCIERGIALELNTSSVRRPRQQVTPGPEILRWYVELGGERVTLGSDAHQTAHLGVGFDLALANLRAAGLRFITHFEGRQATLRPLPI